MSGCCSGGSLRDQAAPRSAPSSLAGGAPGHVIALKGGATFVGTNDPVTIEDSEGPERALVIADFALEAEAVTIARFSDFVAATGYVTDSERFGCSGVFAGLLPDAQWAADSLSDAPWWKRVEGASWKQPEGPGSSIADRLDHPVTHISWRDASAFAHWVGGRLPTEAEWEYAARGNHRQRYPWGDEEPTDDHIFCNIWQGQFPQTNTMQDGYLGTAPARSFAPNESGFYNLAGNVWEWTHDAFRVRSLSRVAKLRNAQALRSADKVLKGGSFLCHKSYCYRYRIAARIGLSIDSASSNTGFRVAYDARR